MVTWRYRGSGKLLQRHDFGARNVLDVRTLEAIGRATGAHEPRCCWLLRCPVSEIEERELNSRNNGLEFF